MRVGIKRRAQRSVGSVIASDPVGVRMTRRFEHASQADELLVAPMADRYAEGAPPAIVRHHDDSLPVVREDERRLPREVLDERIVEPEVAQESEDLARGGDELV